jgi:probable HAF family extracellular repeat protein
MQYTRFANHARLCLEPLEDRRLLSHAVTDLGTLGGSFSLPYEINNSNQVVGYSYTSSFAIHGFLWSRAEGIQDLTTLTGNPNVVVGAGINDSGQIVGSIGIGLQSAYFWDSDSGLVELGTLGHPGSAATDVNNVGEIIGGLGYSGYGGYFIGFHWDSSGGMTQLGAFRPTNAINNSGAMVGISVRGTALLWDPATGRHDLGALPGDTWSTASDINDKGQIVGWSGGWNGSLFEYTPFLWDNGLMTPLALFPEMGKITQNEFLAINNRGQVVGSGRSSVSGTSAPFFWEDGVMVDLNSLIDPSAGWALRWATDINDGGKIVGQGNKDNKWSSFLLTPPLILPAPSIDGYVDVSPWSTTLPAAFQTTSAGAKLTRANSASSVEPAPAITVDESWTAADYNGILGAREWVTAGSQNRPEQCGGDGVNLQLVDELDALAKFRREALRSGHPLAGDR